jgi:hypothetical protein
MAYMKIDDTDNEDDESSVMVIDLRSNLAGAIEPGSPSSATLELAVTGNRSLIRIRAHGAAAPSDPGNCRMLIKYSNLKE